MSITVVLPDTITGDLILAATSPTERAGVLTARCHQAPGGDLRLLGRTLYWASEDSYRYRAATGMAVTPEGYLSALGSATDDGAIPIWLHTHPQNAPRRSERDKVVDSQISDLFRIRSDSEFYGTVIVSPNGPTLDLTGTLQKSGAEEKAIDRFWLIGDRWWLRPTFDLQPHSIEPTLFDRNVRAFGEDVQRTLGMLKIAIVGTGGTGSSIAEQLVRLGVRQLLLVDGDTLCATNVTRVYGSTPTHVGKPKVSVVAQHLAAIAPDLQCETIKGKCTDASIARALANVDLIFGCTDDNAGRLVLSRLSTYYLIPVIDIGVVLSSDMKGLLTGIDGRVTVLSPGNACLVCRNRIDTARASAEMQTNQERTRLADEGYAPALGRVEPAVVAFTTLVASAAINELLERLVGYGHSTRPSEVLLRVHDREFSTNIATPRARHYCHQGQNKWGLGDTEPFLEQLWTM
ncbi:MAG: ThiF family adenylyltransferase [Deltaproteobacteria bacterium]|nr:ThiF family adenylyltransferase [Deltaproteobacteria bacterium]